MLKNLSLEGVEEQTTKESNTREGYYNGRKKKKNVYQMNIVYNKDVY